MQQPATSRLSAAAWSRMSVEQQRAQCEAVANRELLTKSVREPEALTSAERSAIGDDVHLVADVCNLHLSDAKAEAQAKAAGVQLDPEKQRREHERELERISRGGSDHGHGRDAAVAG